MHTKNTLMGTRSNERLVNIPQNIQVINREFLTDVKFDNGIDAGKYAVSGLNKRDSAAPDVNIRGYRVGNAAMLRDGVKFRAGASGPIGNTGLSYRTTVVA